MISIIVNMSKRNIPLQKPNVERITSRGLTYTILVITTSSKPISYTDNNICAEIKNSLLKEAFRKVNFHLSSWKIPQFRLMLHHFKDHNFYSAKQNTINYMQNLNESKYNKRPIYSGLPFSKICNFLVKTLIFWEQSFTL